MLRREVGMERIQSINQPIKDSNECVYVSVYKQDEEGFWIPSFPRGDRMPKRTDVCALRQWLPSTRESLASFGAGYHHNSNSHFLLPSSDRGSPARDRLC